MIGKFSDWGMIVRSNDKESPGGSNNRNNKFSNNKGKKIVSDDLNVVYDSFNYTKQVYSSGAVCAGMKGKKRSAQVTFQCGSSNKILEIVEPEVGII